MAIGDTFTRFFDVFLEDALRKALGDSLPLVGTAIAAKAVSGLDPFSGLQSSLAAAVATTADDVTAIAASINAAAIPNVSASVVGGQVQIAIAVADTLQIGDFGTAIDAGGSSIGFSANAALGATLGSALNLTLSYAPQTGALTLVDTGTDELRFDLDVRADINADVNLGIVQFAAKDQRGADAPEISLDLAVDLTGIGSAADVAVRASGAAHLALELTTKTPSTVLPSFYADLVVDWNFASDGASSPTIRFEDVGVDLGSLLTTISDALTPITDMFGRRPIKDIIDALTNPLPVIDEGLGLIGARSTFDSVPDGGDQRVNFLDLAASYFQRAGDDAKVAQIRDFAFALSIIKQLVELNDRSGDAGRLSFGSFNLVDDGSRPTLDLKGLTPDAFVAQVKQVADTLLGENNVFGDVVGGIAGVIGEVANSALKTAGFSGASGLTIPLLDHPEDAIKLFLPSLYAENERTVTIVEYDIPDLSFDNTFDYFFRLFGPVGINLSGEYAGGIDFSIGYDTTGIATGQFQDGFYIRTQALDDPETGVIGTIPHRASERVGGPDGRLDYMPLAYLYGDINAGVALDVVVARVSANGGLKGYVAAFLPNDEGFLRAPHLEAGCIFDPIEGLFTANVNVKASAGIGPFSISKTIVIAEATLANFSYGCSAGVAAQELGLASDRVDGSADLDLNVGARALTFRLIDKIPLVDVFQTNETYRVRNAVHDSDLLRPTPDDGDPIPGVLGISAFGYEELHGSIERPIGTIFAEFGGGDDTLYMDEGVVQAANADGGSGVDFLSGALGNDTLRGGDDEDILYGRGGNDSLEGGAGDDLLDGGAGADTLLGGLGTDQVTYEKSAVGVTFDFAPQPQSLANGLIGYVGHGGDAEGDVLAGVEYIIGSNFADVLRANLIDKNTLDGGAGNDALYGGLLDDFLVGGAGADIVQGFGGFDGTTYFASQGEVRIDLAAKTAFGGDAEGDRLDSIEAIGGSGYDDELRGDSGENYLDGWLGDDLIDGRGAFFGGRDTLLGGDGNDTVLGSGRGDRLNGGQGTDLLTYGHLATGVTMSLRAGGSSLFGDQIGKVTALSDGSLKFEQDDDVDYSSFENLDGSQAADTLEGDSGYNVIRGLAGNDTIRGLGGDDTLAGGTGADSMVGGLGFDWADYSESAGAVTVDLAAGTGSRNDAEGDRLSEIENLRGSAFADILKGDGADNVLAPGLSNGGMDVVAGGAGIDTLLLDYSLEDDGRGMVGGYALGSTQDGAFTRLGTVFNQILDRASFTEIERLDVTGTIKGDEIRAGTGGDIIKTGGGNDTIYAGRGSDQVLAGDDDDDVWSGTNANRELSTGISAPVRPIIFLDGGRGIDTLSISLSTETEAFVLAGGSSETEFQGVNLRLSNGSAIENFEVLQNVVAGQGGDAVTITGAGDNAIDGFLGQDTLAPGLGIDTVSGGFDYEIGVEVNNGAGGINPQDAIFVGAVFNPGSFVRFTEADPEAFALNSGDLVRLDYSSVAGTAGVVSDINLADSDTPFYAGGDPVILKTNEGYYRVGTVAAPITSVDLREIERLDVVGTLRNDRIEGTADSYSQYAFEQKYGHDNLLRGDDILSGLAGNDTITGNTGDDSILGGDGADFLTGTNSSLYVEDDATTRTTLTIGERDTLTGGSGADTFALGTTDGYYYGYTSGVQPGGRFPADPYGDRAIVTDFTPGEGDKIQLHGAAADYRVSFDGTSTLIRHVESSQDAGNVIGEIRGFANFDLAAAYVSYANPIIIATPFAGAAGDPDIELGNIDLVAFSAPYESGEGELPISGIPPLQTFLAAPSLAPETSPLALAALAAQPWAFQSNDRATLLGSLFGADPASSGITFDPGAVTLTGDGRAFGTFDGDPFGIGSGIVLSTGRVADLNGTNTVSGGVPSTTVTATFERIGRVGQSDIFRADLTDLAPEIRSLVIQDNNLKNAGAGGEASGFDLDAIVLSNTYLATVDGLTLAQLNGSVTLPRLDVFDFSAAGIDFRPGTQRPGDGFYPNRPNMYGAIDGNRVDQGRVRLDLFDSNEPARAGDLSLGDGGRIGFDLKQAVATDKPLYLYLAEAGASGENIERTLSVSDARLAGSNDLSTDFGAPGAADDTITFTYRFEKAAGANVDSVFFNFALFSEELPEFGGSLFNDTFKIKLNGVNLAKLSDGSAATVNNLGASAFGPYSPDLVLNGVVGGAAAAATAADAYTRILSFAGALAATGPNVLTIEVADVRDGVLDSGILVKAGTFKGGIGLGGVSVAPPTGPDGGPAVVQEGGAAVLVPITIDPGPTGTLTGPVAVTLTPGPDIDLGNGPGVAVTVTVHPGDPLTFEVPVTAAGDSLAEGSDFGLIEVTVESDDPRYDGAGIPPIVVEIAPNDAGPGTPTLSLASDTGLSGGDSVTRDPTLLAIGPAGAALTYSLDGAAYSATLPVLATDGTADGPHTVAIRATDGAGNVVDGASLAFVLDTTAPRATGLAYGPNDGTLGLGESITFEVALSEAVTIAGGVPTLALNDGGTASYVSGSGTTTLVFSHTVMAGQNSADLALVGFSANGAALTDVAGNPALLSGGFDPNPVGILIVSTAVAALPTLALALDTGVAGDRLTSDPTLVATVPDGATLTFSLDGGTFTTVLPDLPTDGTAEGPHSVAVRATDGAGNVVDGASLAFVLDTIGPKVTIDSVSRASNVVHHTISGSVDAEGLGSSIVVRDGENLLGTATVDASGHWSLPLYYGGDGPAYAYRLSATGTVADAAGNVGSDPLGFDLDFAPNRPLFGTVEHDVHSVAGLVFSLYDGFLARAPDVSGWQSAVSALESGLSVGDFAQSLANSPERLQVFGALSQGSDEAFVDQLYATALGRVGEDAGRQFHLNELTGGASRLDVALHFALSPENQAQIGAAFAAGVFVPDADASDVARLYYGLLDREPEREGLAFYSGFLQAGSTVVWIAQNFLASPEYVGRTGGASSDAAFIEGLYTTMLDRPSEAAGFQFWAERLAGGSSRAEIALGFADSPEAVQHIEGKIEAGWHLF